MRAVQLQRIVNLVLFVSCTDAVRQSTKFCHSVIVNLGAQHCIKTNAGILCLFTLYSHLMHDVQVGEVRRINLQADYGFIQSFTRHEQVTLTFIALVHC
jgi:hypothetical protein